MQKLFFDFFPVLIFFVAYKLFNIYTATAALMVAVMVQVAYVWMRFRKIEAMHIITLILVLVFGGLTLYFHDDMFIKWKVSIINWLFAVALIASMYLMKKPIIQRLMEDNFTLPSPVWRRLNLVWALFFLFVGCVNLLIVYSFSEDIWVYFKSFGIIGMTLLFTIGQIIYLWPHIKNIEP